MSKLVAFVTLLLLAANIAVHADNATRNEMAALMERAELCRRSGNLEEADRLYTQVLSVDSKNCSALDHRGECFFVRGEYKKALDDANKWIVLSPDEVSYLRRAQVWIKLGKFELALADLNRSLEDKGELPRSVEYLYLLRSFVHMMLTGHRIDADKDAYTHLAMVPRSVLSFELCSIADAWCARPADSISNLTSFSYGKFHNAELNSSRSQAQDKKWREGKLFSDPDVHNSQYQALSTYRAQIHFAQGVFTNNQRKQLLARLEKDHAGLTPEQYHFARAILYFYQREYDRTISEAALCRSGKMQLCSDLLTCYCFIIKRAYPQARDILNRLTSRYPESQVVLDAVDLYHYQADKRQIGIDEIKGLLNKNPKNEAALVELAKIYRDLSELKDALKYCDLSLQLNPGSAELLLMKANILTSQQNFADGLKILSQIIAKDPQNGAAYLERAAIYTQQAHWSDAISDLTQTLKLKYELGKTLRARAACYGALNKFDLQRKDLIVLDSIE